MLDKFDLMNDLRAAVIRMNIEMVQVNTIVLALRHDLITCAQAFEWLDRAHEERSGWLTYLKVEPRLDALRSDSRFDDLLHRVRLIR